jgi:uncharacterized protein (DUF1800 family)
MAFGTNVDRLAQFEGWSPGDVIEQMLAESPLEPEPPQLGSDDDYGKMPQWWLDVMARPDAGLHERMVWMWHGLITSSLDKASPALMLRQHNLLREHALGNFRDLIQAITTDAAMLYWLDGAGSSSEAPNENYSRELLELFTFGRESGAYTEADVRAGATAFSGWWVDGDNDDTVEFDVGSGPQGAVDLLGVSVASAEEAVDAICYHPACARFIAAKVHQWFVGEPPTDGHLEYLSQVFTDGGLAIRPLVEAVVRDPIFLESRLNRPRTAVEWYVAVRAFFDVEIDWWVLDGLGQVPFVPPNVAGWPGNTRWLSAGSEFGKAQLALDYAWDTATFESDDPIGEALARAGLYEVSDETVATLSATAGTVEGRRELASLLHSLIAVSPEFSLA